MKKIILILLTVAFLCGCAALQQGKVDATACLVDPVCRAEAVSQADSAKGIAKDVAGVSPIPLSSNLVGSLVYGAVFIIALIKGGRKKREEAVNA